MSLNKKSVDDINVAGKRVLVRCDFNVPMKDGVIADYEITQSMLKYFIKQAMGNRPLVRPRILVGVPSGVTEVEKRAVIDATIEAGANAITWTPPTNGEVFRDIMNAYREGKPHP